MEREGKDQDTDRGACGRAGRGHPDGVGLGIQSAGRGRDLSASTTALQEIRYPAKAQAELVDVKSQADELRARLDGVTAESQPRWPKRKSSWPTVRRL
jgi:hypothetical protein